MNTSLDEWLGVERGRRSGQQSEQHSYPVVPRRLDSANPFGWPGIQLPVSVIYGNNHRIHEVVMGILLYHKPPPARILDPTCGEENYQFRPWLENGTLERLGYEYVSMDIQPVGEIRYDIFCGLPLRGNYFDVAIYDPPYLTNPARDGREKDYGMTRHQSPQRVKQYYSRKVFGEFARVLRRDGILIVKGADFYYPMHTDYLNLFVEMVADYKAFFRPIALYVYRFFANYIPLYRYRMRHYRRPLPVHTYFLVLKKRA